MDLLPPPPPPEDASDSGVQPNVKRIEPEQDNNIDMETEPQQQQKQEQEPSEPESDKVPPNTLEQAPPEEGAGMQVEPAPEEGQVVELPEQEPEAKVETSAEELSDVKVENESRSLENEFDINVEPTQPAEEEISTEDPSTKEPDPNPLESVQASDIDMIVVEQSEPQEEKVEEPPLGNDTELKPLDTDQPIEDVSDMIVEQVDAQEKNIEPPLPLPPPGNEDDLKPLESVPLIEDVNDIMAKDVKVEKETDTKPEPYAKVEASAEKLSEVKIEKQSGPLEHEIDMMVDPSQPVTETKREKDPESDVLDSKREEAPTGEEKPDPSQAMDQEELEEIYLNSGPGQSCLLRVPSGFSDSSPEVLNQFFSLSTWDSLSQDLKTHLKVKIPDQTFTMAVDERFLCL